METIKVFNTGETQDELRKKYNPEGSDRRKAQLRMLDMLIYLDETCRKIGVEYRLDAGTVLGAVRHEGFIPWDDDVDVAIPLYQYNKLCDYLLNNPHQEFVLQSPKTDRWRLSFWNTLRDIKSIYVHKDVNMLDAKLKYKGLQIDLFPVFEGSIPFLHKIIGYIHGHLCIGMLGKHDYLALMVYYLFNHIFIPIAYFISKLFGNKKKVQYAYGPGFVNIWEKDIVYPYKPILFEGHIFSGPNQPIKYCQTIYGDFYKLPKEDHRYSHPVDYVFL